MKFQIMPEPHSWDFDRLVEGMKAHGYLPGHEVIVDEDGVIVDGYTRERASLLALNHPAPRRVVKFADDWDKWLHAYLTNTHRRHLTPTQRREMIREYVKRYPGQTNAQVARDSGVSDKTVARVRKQLEANGEIPVPTAFDIPVELRGERSDWDDARTPVAEADHRNEVWVEVVIGYPAPADAVRQHGEGGYVREKERSEWTSGRIVLQVPAAVDRKTLAAMIEDLAQKLYRAAIDRPLRTMDPELAGWR